MPSVVLSMVLCMLLSGCGTLFVVKGTVIDPARPLWSPEPEMSATVPTEERFERLSGKSERLSQVTVRLWEGRPRRTELQLGEDVSDSLGRFYIKAVGHPSKGLVLELRTPGYRRREVLITGNTNDPTVQINSCSRERSRQEVCNWLQAATFRVAGFGTRWPSTNVSPA